MKLTALTLAATLVASAAAANTSTGEAFAQCGVHNIAAKNGLTVAQVRAAYPTVIRDAEDALLKVARDFFALPVDQRGRALIAIEVMLPDTGPCLRILDQ